MFTDYKSMVRQVLEEIWNKGDVSLVDEFFTEDCILYSPLAPQPIQGRENLKRWIMSVRHPICNFHMAPVGHLIAEDEQVAERWKLTGRHVGFLVEMPIGGKSIQLEGSTIYRFEGSQIAEVCMCHDVASLMQQFRFVTDLETLGANQRQLSLVSVR